MDNTSIHIDDFDIFDYIPKEEQKRFEKWLAKREKKRKLKEGHNEESEAD